MIDGSLFFGIARGQQSLPSTLRMWLSDIRVDDYRSVMDAAGGGKIRV